LLRCCCAVAALLLRCRCDPRWASEEIARLREIVWCYVDPCNIQPQHMEAVTEATKGYLGDANT
jgi:hypothetical protein